MNGLHWRFILRQLSTSRSQSAIFVFCVALSMVSLVALRSFGQRINQALLADARELQAADIVVESSFPFTEPTQQLLAELESGPGTALARTWEFYTVARLPLEDETLLVSIKAAEPGYPFYGRVDLASGSDLAEMLQPGRIVVEQALLDRLALAVGDELLLGNGRFQIADVVIREPDRPLDFFTLGPRVLLAATDLPATDLIQPGSRVTYSALVRTESDARMEETVGRLREVREPGLESVESYRSAPSGVRSFFDNLLFFLSLAAIFTMLLAGIGIQAALAAFLRERYTTIAVIKTLGATQRFVTLQFYVVVSLLGLAGTGLGLLLAPLLQRALPILLGDLLPPDVELSLTPANLAEGVLLGAFVVLSFTFVPLLRLGELRPGFIFRKEEEGAGRRWPYAVAAGLILLAFVLTVLWLLKELTTALYFVAVVLGLLSIAGAVSEIALRALRRLHLPSLALRQALAGLFRPRNPTRSILITLSASLAVLFCLFLVERALDANFVESFPEDAPNVFIIDIQPDQVEEVRRELDREGPFYPVVRGSVMLVNGQERRRQNRGQRDDLREDRRDFQFSLTYRDQLLDNERLLQGEALFRPDLTQPQVSLLDDVMDYVGAQIGDRITFRIQGVPLEATVSSIRTRTGDSIEPFFSFVFPTAVLQNAPQTIFTALRAAEAEIPALQSRLVNRFPTVTVIDVTATIDTFAGLARRITRVIRFFTGFSMAAGLLIVMSAVYATRFARIQEAAYYKVMGARSRFVQRVFAAENLLLGAVSGLLGLTMAQVGSWLITTRLFDLAYRPFWLTSATMVLVTVLLVAGVGMVASLPILGSRPVQFLRRQTEEE